MGKRKAASKKAEGSRKKTKIVHKNPDDLPWKTVKRPVVAGLDGDDGILELEEVEDVEVVYEETEGGRVARFNVSMTARVASRGRTDGEEGPTRRGRRRRGLRHEGDQRVGGGDGG